VLSTTVEEKMKNLADALIRKIVKFLVVKETEHEGITF
jgi:hypothetical protein